MNSKELTEKIEEASGLAIDELPKVTGLSWFGGVKDGKPTAPVAVIVNAPFPMLDGAVVYAMFQNDDVVRVYTLSQNKEKASPPSRYTFSKTAPTFVAEVMSLETFIDEIAEEWQMVAGLDDIELEDEPDADAEKPNAAVSSDTVDAATLTT